MSEATRRLKMAWRALRRGDLVDPETDRRLALIQKCIADTRSMVADINAELNEGEEWRRA